MIVAAAIGPAVSAMGENYEGVRAGRADADYVESRKCVACHGDHYQSWARTYHIRMTQESRPGSVQGDFDNNNTFEYQCVTSRMERRNDSFVMTFTYPDSRVESNTIVRTVG